MALMIPAVTVFAGFFVLCVWLVVRGQRDLREGVRVKVTEVATAPDGSLPTDPADLTRGTAGPRIETEAVDSGVEGGR